MRKKIIKVAITLVCILSLASCGQNIAKEAAEKGKSYFDSGDYETAAKAFGVAIENGNTDEEINLLYDITLKYHQANTAYEEEKYETANKILDSIDSKYENYGIRESILALKNDVTKILDSEELLLKISSALEENNYIEAGKLINDVDVYSLTTEQLKRFNKYKSMYNSADITSDENSAQNPEETQQTEVTPEIVPTDDSVVKVPEETVEQPQISAQEKAAQEKAAQEKAAQEKAAQEKAAQEKAAQEKAAQEKAAQEKAAKEKAAQEKAAKEKAAQEKAAKEKAAQEKAAQEKAAQEKAAQEKVEQNVYVQPAINTNVANDVYIYPTDTTLLTVEQLSTLTKNDISLIRNEIYARKGHIFTTATYQNYFAQKTWYVPTAPVSWTDLNEVEKANIRLIKEFETNNQ